MIEDELPNPETRTTEQLLIDSMTEIAESALNSSGQVLDDTHRSRMIYENGMFLDERLDELGNSVFKLSYGNRDGGAVYGEWAKGSSEVVATGYSNEYVKGEKTLLDLEGLTKLKEGVDKRFASPDIPESSSAKVPKGKVAQFMGRQAMKVQAKRSRRSERIVQKEIQRAKTRVAKGKDPSNLVDRVLDRL